MKKTILFMLMSSIMFALTTVKPSKLVRFSYYISKITFNKNYLIAGLENGKIEIKNFNTQKTLKIINLPKIHDFMGNLIPMPIYSLDILNNRLLILAQGENASRILYIYNIKTDKLNKIFQVPTTFMQARFTDKNHILFAMLSDEIKLYNLQTKKYEYDNQIGNYVFSIFELNPDKTLAAIGDESGNIKIIDVKNGKKVATIIGYNKDKTISIGFQKNLILNASVDERIALYKKDGYQLLKLKSEFIPYAADIAPDEKTFAYQCDEQNDIMVRDLNNKPLCILKGHTMTLNELKYIGNKTILSFSPAEIIIWKIKGE